MSWTRIMRKYVEGSARVAPGMRKMHIEGSTMSQRDAEIAIGMQLFNENPGMTNEQAMTAGEEFIRKGDCVVVDVDLNGRNGRYWGKSSDNPNSCMDDDSDIRCR